MSASLNYFHILFEIILATDIDDLSEQLSGERRQVQQVRCRPKSDPPSLPFFQIWGRTIRKLKGGGGRGWWEGVGGGWAGVVQKKYSRKGKLIEKKFMHAN